MIYPRSSDGRTDGRTDHHQHTGQRVGSHDQHGAATKPSRAQDESTNDFLHPISFYQFISSV